MTFIIPHTNVNFQTQSIFIEGILFFRNMFQYATIDSLHPLRHFTPKTMVTHIFVPFFSIAA